MLLAPHLPLVGLEAAEEAEEDLGEQDLAVGPLQEDSHPGWAHLAAVLAERLAAGRFLAQQAPRHLELTGAPLAQQKTLLDR